MEENVWKIKFNATMEETPSSIANKYCKQLYEMTDKKVMAKVEPVDMRFKDMSKIYTFTWSKNYFEDDIQAFLGETGEESKFTFELYITGAKTKSYKYRFCFIEYGIPAYPVSIALDKEIASELLLPEVCDCNNSDEFKRVFVKIINTNKLKNVIEGVMSVN